MFENIKTVAKVEAVKVVLGKAEDKVIALPGDKVAREVKKGLLGMGAILKVYTKVVSFMALVYEGWAKSDILAKDITVILDRGKYIVAAAIKAAKNDEAFLSALAEAHGELTKFDTDYEGSFKSWVDQLEKEFKEIEEGTK